MVLTKHVFPHLTMSRLMEVDKMRGGEKLMCEGQCNSSSKWFIS